MINPRTGEAISIRLIAHEEMQKANERIICTRSATVKFRRNGFSVYVGRHDEHDQNAA